MHHTLRGLLTVLTSAGCLAAVAALGPSALADPVNRNSSEVLVTCSDGTSYLTTQLDRSGMFSPAHDLNSTAVLVPTSFGGAHIEIRTLDGQTLLAAFDEDWSQVKGATPAHLQGTMDCVATISGPEDVPGFGEVLVTAEIGVTAVVTPRG